ncbi:MAG: outer membrane beta-barrel protein [Gemmatimonadaceae bacterium]|nr:outer membrane beta-barrel protein [Chitinophagaceae bacterium]
MTKVYLLLAALCLTISTMAQTDSTKTGNPDTVHVGNMIIVKKSDGNYERKGGVEYSVKHKSGKKRNVSTNWGVVDLGFANYSDKTDYTSPAVQAFALGSDKDKFDLRNGKSINVNIWIVMQRVNLIKHVVNLKYGVGLELNNYRYTTNWLYNKDNNNFRIDATRNYKKNKLAADYATVPVMLNFNFTPNNRSTRSFGLSVGASAGYLYSARQKIVTNEDGKQKIHDDYQLNQFKLSYIAEVQLGPVKLYGSLATESMFEKHLDHTPFNLGIRLSNW